MSDLFNSPVLLIDQPSLEPEYRITDPQEVLLAQVTQVGGERKSGLRRFFSSGADNSRTVLRVTRPDGLPLFFVDQSAVQPGAFAPSTAVVAPDGSLIGRVEHDTAAFASSYLATGGRGHQQSYRLCAADNQPLCNAVWEKVEVRSVGHDPHGVGGRFCLYTDANGTEIARLDFEGAGMLGTHDRYTLRLYFQLPDPLRVLVIASSLAMD